LHHVNADVIGRELALAPYEAAQVADALRWELLKRGESFVFETVFSDPIGDKLAFLEQAARSGHIVVVCYIGLAVQLLQLNRKDRARQRRTLIAAGYYPG
jgi:predicted ABC-type ATPase